MKMTEYIINSEFTIENKLNYQSVIELLCDRLNTDSHHNCFVSKSKIILNISVVRYSTYFKYCV